MSPDGPEEMTSIRNLAVKKSFPYSFISKITWPPDYRPNSTVMLLMKYVMQWMSSSYVGMAIVEENIREPSISLYIHLFLNKIYFENLISYPKWLFRSWFNIIRVKRIVQNIFLIEAQAVAICICIVSVLLLSSSIDISISGIIFFPIKRFITLLISNYISEPCRKFWFSPIDTEEFYCKNNGTAVAKSNTQL